MRNRKANYFYPQVVHIVYNLFGLNVFAVIFQRKQGDGASIDEDAIRRWKHLLMIVHYAKLLAL